MIVKMQIPLNRVPAPMAIVYNEDRSFETYLPIDDRVIRLMGNE